MTPGLFIATITAAHPSRNQQQEDAMRSYRIIARLTLKN